MAGINRNSHLRRACLAAGGVFELAAPARDPERLALDPARMARLAQGRIRQARRPAAVALGVPSFRFRPSGASNDAVLRPFRAAYASTAFPLKGAAKLAGGIASAFESLLGGGSKPAKDESKRPLDAAPMPPNTEHEEATHREQEQKSARRQKYS